MEGAIGERGHKSSEIHAFGKVRLGGEGCQENKIEAGRTHTVKKKGRMYVCL